MSTHTAALALCALIDRALVSDRWGRCGRYGTPGEVVAAQSPEVRALLSALRASDVAGDAERWARALGVKRRGRFNANTREAYEAGWDE